MTKDEVIASMAIVTINKDDAIYLSLPSTRAVMDEYAKQQAIAFSEWIGKEGYFTMYNEKSRWRTVKAKYTCSWTTEELFNKFIEQQNKDGR